MAKVAVKDICTVFKDAGMADIHPVPVTGLGDRKKTVVLREGCTVIY